MIQKKFLCKDINAAREAIGQIGDIAARTKHRSGVVTFYEKGFSTQEMEEMVAMVKGLGIPGLQVAGISITVIVELLPEGTGMLINLVLAEESDIEVLPIPCQPGGELEAARVLNDRLTAIGNAKVAELFVSNMKLNTTPFMENAMKGHEDVVLFGTANLRNLAQRVSGEVGDEKVLEVEKISPEIQDDELIIGKDILYDGFVVIIFSGDRLKAKANYVLGWKPIGRRFSVELGEKPPIGETLVNTINSLPAVDIYREYLGVYPDEYFISNICEFPFVVEREGINICMVPMQQGVNGELYFMMALRPEDKLRFSFASHDEVLYSSRESLETMEAFGPEALFLTLCGNRLNFLKEDASLEWNGFGKMAPDYALMHGAGELYYYEGRGGILNSAHLAIGIREADDPLEETVYEHPTVESLRRGRTMPLSDRMSVFLDKITSELIDMATQAQDANHAKSVFLSHMSHEIRTPINAILGMDEMILKESKEPGIQEYADSIRSAGGNLLGIVNDILDFSKIEAGKMRIVPAEYELINVIKDMYNVVRLRAQDKGLMVKLDIDPALPAQLYGDSTRIKQVITNILTNAVKYTETGSVTLIIKRAEAGADSGLEALKMACPGDELPEKSVRLKVAVKDTGIGIKPEDMAKLFDEFERFDEKRNRKIEGTGLGLSITKDLLELMGSRLTVDSTYGEGSEFGFEIVQGVAGDEAIGNVDEKMKRPVDRKKRVSFTAEDARILVVDDTKVNLIVVTKLLQKTKIKIDTVTSGEEALALVQKHAYDMIFLDHLMPKMSGPETLVRMNELENNLSAGAPVVSLTSNASPNAREEYINMGFKDYLLKPFRPEELEDMLFYHIAPEKIRTTLPVI